MRSATGENRARYERGMFLDGSHCFGRDARERIRDDVGAVRRMNDLAGG
jgi:hypothetical protein